MLFISGYHLKHESAFGSDFRCAITYNHHDTSHSVHGILYTNAA